jgi:methionine aminopeptidase
VHRKAEGRPHTGSYSDEPDNAARCRSCRRTPAGDYGTALSAAASAATVLRTTDGTRAAHFEHTVAVTDGGPRVLTVP